VNGNGMFHTRKKKKKKMKMKKNKQKKKNGMKETGKKVGRSFF